MEVTGGKLPNDVIDVVEKLRVACLNIATKSPLPLDLVEHYSHLYGIGDGLHGMLWK